MNYKTYNDLLPIKKGVDMLRNICLIIAAGFLTVGCSPYSQITQYPQGYMTSSQVQSDQLARKMKLGYENLNQCGDALRASPIGQQITKTMLIMSDSQENKYDLFSSKSKLNEAQKKVLKSFLAEQNKCTKLLTDAASGTPYAIAITKRYSDNDAVYTKLLSGQMTIGEANLARDQIRVKSREEVMAIGKSLDDGFNNSHNAEVTAMERRRVAEIQAAQQQQIINQNQQLINNQIQQNMKPPAPRTPIQTDCYRMGNSVSCTTQ